LVRMMLENSERSKVNLKDELTMLTTYIQLESMRFNNTIDFNIHLDESIDPENTCLPSMVLQPFVENAIWHGLMHHENTRMLNINITEKNDFLHCSITDNGIGREASMKINKQNGFNKKSMGIKITTERLRLLTKQSVRELIDIIDLKDTENVSLGTQVNVLIPIS
jgi:LytS/YehU family sensor histidine kinase